MIKNKVYSYVVIERFALKNDFIIRAHGTEIIGEYFIVFKNDYDQVISFVYSSYCDKGGGNFTCIYSDIKPEKYVTALMVDDDKGIFDLINLSNETIARNFETESEAIQYAKDNNLFVLE